MSNTTAHAKELESQQTSPVSTDADLTVLTANHETLGSNEATGARASSKSTPTGKRGYRWLWIVAAVIAVVLFFRLRPTGDATPVGGPQERPTPVRAAAIVRGDLAMTSSYSGELVGEVADIAPQVSGLLQEVPLRIGSVVSRGDLIAVINDVDLRNQLNEAKGQLGVARANVRRTEAELEGVEADHRRSVDLHRQEVLSDQEFDRVVAQLATSKATVAASEAQVEQATARVALLTEQLSYTRVLAPFDGIVGDRYLDRGALVQPGTRILRLVERAPLVVQFRVPERDLSVVRPDVELTVTTHATGDAEFSGRVLRISGEVSRTDRTTLVEAALGETTDLLRPGMFAEVRVQTRDLESVLVAPGAAVLRRVLMSGEESTGVLVARGGSVEWVPVRVLGQAEGRIALEGRLAEGALVLTMGHAELDSGSPIRIVQRDDQPDQPVPPPVEAQGTDGSES